MSSYLNVLLSTVLVVINGVWNLVIKRFSSKFIPYNNIYSSNKAYVGKILVVLDTIRSFRGEGLFLTRYIPIQLGTCATIMLTKHSYIHVYYHHRSLPCKKSTEMYSKSHMLSLE